MTITYEYYTTTSNHPSPVDNVYESEKALIADIELDKKQRSIAEENNVESYNTFDQIYKYKIEVTQFKGKVGLDQRAFYLNLMNQSEMYRNIHELNTRTFPHKLLAEIEEYALLSPEEKQKLGAKGRTRIDRINFKYQQNYIMCKAQVIGEISKSFKYDDEHMQGYEQLLSNTITTRTDYNDPDVEPIILKTPEEYADLAGEGILLFFVAMSKVFQANKWGKSLLVEGLLGKTID